MRTTAIAPWYGSNRTLAHHVGELLAGCEWVGVPFAGGMCEVAHITARTVHVGDLHRHVINLARTIADDELRRELIKHLRRLIFHPDELDQAQEWCKVHPPGERLKADLSAACSYFMCCWMGRSHIAGTADEFHGKLSTRWNASGGDSNVRFRSAVRGIAAWGKIARRCTFSVMDAFEFLPRCEDSDGHGIYADPPFFKAGRRYKHNAGKTEADEREWHTRLRECLARFEKTKVVVRFYDHPFIRELYQESKWRWVLLDGGKTQANTKAPEVLLVNQGETAGLFK